MSASILTVIKTYTIIQKIPEPIAELFQKLSSTQGSICRQTDRETDIQTARLTDRQTDRQTDRHPD